jgi:S-DNA-T family DNA segregation ATPase FtsK/SpoIIIE
MLFLPPGVADMVRAQGTFISDDEVQRVVDFIKKQRQADFTALDLPSVSAGEEGEINLDGDDGGAVSDELYEAACRIVLGTGRGSVSLLQRKLEIGYTRAARLVDMMAADGIVGDYKGAKAREVVMSLDEWEARRGKGRALPVAEDAPLSHQDLRKVTLDDDLLQETRALEDMDGDE